MQNDERAPASNLSSKDLTACPCNACFPRKDLCSDSLGLEASHPRELYNYNRVVGFPSNIPILPYAPISTSPASLYGPLHLHRPGYPRAMFSASDGRFDLPLMQGVPNKDSRLLERQIVHSQSPQLDDSEAGSASYWEQASGSGSADKPRRMRTVFTPQQLERLERHFKSQQYVGSAQRIYIAKQLGLSETQVKVWFQNRRIRWRKQALGAVAKSQ